MVLFLGYLCGALYGCMNLNEGLDRKRLPRVDSYAIDYYDAEDTYFRNYPYRVQVCPSPYPFSQDDE